MFGNNLISVFINLLFFFAILAVAHFLGNNMAKPKNKFAIAGTIIAMAMFTYIPKVGYPIVLVVIFLLLLVNKRLEYRIAAVAFTISFAVAFFISFLIAHSFFMIPLSSIGIIIPIATIIVISIVLYIIYISKTKSPS
jgi:hypothetical protein